MDTQDVASYLQQQRTLFPPHHLHLLEKLLLNADEAQMARFASTPLKSPGVALLLAIFGGMLGLDRFYLGQPAAAAGKVLTGALCGTWWLADCILIRQAARMRNQRKAMEILG